MLHVTCRDTHGVIIIIIGNGHDNLNSNPEQGCLPFTEWKDMNSDRKDMNSDRKDMNSAIPSAMGK